MWSRRGFIKAVSGMSATLAMGHQIGCTRPEQFPEAEISNVEIDGGVRVTTTHGVSGYFQGSRAQDMDTLKSNLQQIRKLLMGMNPHDRALDGELLWEAIYPGKAQLFAEGRDPLTGESIVNKVRGERHSPTSRVFMAFSTVDNALWDLRGKLLNKPAYQVIGDANRSKVPVYWRPGEADKGLDEARKRAHEAFDRGYIYQKWYFTKSAKDGPSGFKENVELARVLREELPDAHLMFDNHSIRYYADVDYSVDLCKAVAQYNPFWMEEPICPEHWDGYQRIKEESGVTIAGGEHWITRWQLEPFLKRKCVDYVQVDPVWCGGISEWLKMVEMVQEYPDLKVVPHITFPWIAAPHCVASQPESLCPLAEFNAEGGREALVNRMSRGQKGNILVAMPTAPGIT